MSDVKATDKTASTNATVVLSQKIDKNEKSRQIDNTEMMEIIKQCHAETMEKLELLKVELNQLKTTKSTSRSTGTKTTKTAVKPMEVNTKISKNPYMYFVDFAGDSASGLLWIAEVCGHDKATTFLKTLRGLKDSDNVGKNELTVEEIRDLWASFDAETKDLFKEKHRVANESSTAKNSTPVKKDSDKSDTKPTKTSSKDKISKKSDDD